MYLIYLDQQRRYVFNYAYLDPKWPKVNVFEFDQRRLYKL